MRASDYIGQRLKQVRTQRGWNAKDLAERCAEIGAPEMTASVIANIETGRRNSSGRRRRDVTVDELLLLAYALEVPPDFLFVPLDGADKLAITPAAEMDGVRAASWLIGHLDGYRGVGEPTTVGSAEDRAKRSNWFHNTMGLTLLRSVWFHLSAINEMSRVHGAAAPEVIGAHLLRQSGEDDTPLQVIARLIDEIAALGLTPPALPKVVVDMLRDPDVELRRPLRYPADLLVSDEAPE